MNDKQILYFTTAAKLGSFSKAAKCLYVSVPTLSRSIAALEQEMELTLFVRTNTDVKLTKQGETVFRWMSEAQDSYSKMLMDAKKHNSVPEELKIAISGGQMLDPVFQSALRMLENEASEVTVRLSRDRSDLIESLDSGDNDMVMVLCYELLERDDLNSLILCELETLLVLPQEHPLAGKSGVRLRDFQDEAFVMFEKGRSTHNREAMLKIFKENNFTPRLFEAQGTDKYLGCIELGRGIGIGNPNHIMCNTPTLTEIRVPELANHPTKSVLMWKKANKKKCIQRLIQLIESQEHVARADKAMPKVE